MVRVVGVLCAVQFVDVLTTTLVVAALPQVLRGVGAAPGAASLVAPAYAVLFGSLLVLGARLGDRHGHHRVLQLGLVGYGSASVVSALAPSVPVLVAGRCLLGAAAAVSVPSAMRLLLQAAPGAARQRALAAWSGTGAVAGAAGLLLGGLITEWLGWRALFWLGVPVGAALVLAVRRLVPDPTRAARAVTGLDLPGAATLVAVVGTVIVGADLLQTPATRLLGTLLLAAALPLLVVLRRVERRSPAPLLPGPALRRPALRAGVAASFVNTATTSSAVTLTTLHLQDDAGYGATAASLVLLPFSVLVVAGSMLAPRRLARSGERRTVAVGHALVGSGCAGLLIAPTAPWTAAVSVGVAGLGLGLASVAATAWGTAVPEDLQTTAAGLLNTAAQLGTAMGVALVLTVASTAGDAAGWGLSAVVAVTAAVVPAACTRLRSGAAASRR